MAISPGGRPIDYSSLNRSPKVNWVEKAGGLPKYVRGVARAIARRRHGGDVQSSDIAAAINRLKKWAAGGDNVRPQVQAAAAAAIAEWEAKQSASHSLSAPGANDIELDWTDFNQKRGRHPRTKRVSYVPQVQKKPRVIVEPTGPTPGQIQARDAAVARAKAGFAKQFNSLPPEAQNFLKAAAKLRQEAGDKTPPDLSGLGKKDRAAASKFLRALQSDKKKKLRAMDSSVKKQVAAKVRGEKKAEREKKAAAKKAASAAKKNQRAKLGDIDGSIRSLRRTAGAGGRDAAIANAAIARLNSSRSKAAIGLAVERRQDIELGKMGSKWKHEYIPLNAAAVALKNHKTPSMPGGDEPKAKIDYKRKTAKKVAAKKQAEAPKAESHVGKRVTFKTPHGGDGLSGKITRHEGNRMRVEYGDGSTQDIDADQHTLEIESPDDALARSRAERAKLREALAARQKNAGKGARVFGPLMQVHGAEDGFTRGVVSQMDSMPEHVLQKLADAHVSVVITGGPLTDVPAFARLKGVRPRGWPAGKTWTDAGGVYATPGTSKGGTAAVANGESGAVSTIGHELGHGYERQVLTTAERAAVFKQMRSIARAGKVAPYFKQKSPAGEQELFAEAFGAYTTRGVDGIMEGMKWTVRDEAQRRRLADVMTKIVYPTGAPQ